ncbi:MAG: hypothetical protein U5K69_14270 [Balneolaceae bacterium]|nr:hypothetical protein [Balneolaceae bacterium]
MLESLRKWLEFFSVSGSLPNMLISTAILILVTIILRWVISRYIRRSVSSTELRRRWLVQSRNGLLLLLLLGLLFIWGEELRALALLYCCDRSCFCGGHQGADSLRYRVYSKDRVPALSISW